MCVCVCKYDVCVCPLCVCRYTPKSAPVCAVYVALLQSIRWDTHSDLIQAGLCAQAERNTGVCVYPRALPPSPWVHFCCLVSPSPRVGLFLSCCALAHGLWCGAGVACLDSTPSAVSFYTDRLGFTTREPVPPSDFVPLYVTSARLCLVAPLSFSLLDSPSRSPCVIRISPPFSPLLSSLQVPCAHRLPSFPLPWAPPSPTPPPSSPLLPHRHRGSPGWAGLLWQF